LPAAPRFFSPHIDHNRAFSKENRHLAGKIEVSFRFTPIRTPGQVGMTNIPLFSNAKAALDAYPGTRTAMLPEPPVCQ